MDILSKLALQYKLEESNRLGHWVNRWEGFDDEDDDDDNGNKGGDDYKKWLKTWQKHEMPLTCLQHIISCS